MAFKQSGVSPVYGSFLSNRKGSSLAECQCGNTVIGVCFCVSVWLHWHFHSDKRVCPDDADTYYRVEIGDSVWNMDQTGLDVSISICMSL